MRLNEKAFQHAQKLIAQGKIETVRKWSKDRPALIAKVDPIETIPWDEYAIWFLGEDTDAPPRTKQRVRFPYGNFDKVYRGALIISQYQAKQFGFHNILNSITHLLEQIDRKNG